MTKLIIIWFIFINFLSFILFYLDKKAAVQQLRRIPENVLHKIEYLGGWLGSLIAAEKFKHKRRKQSYMKELYKAALFNMIFISILTHFI